MSTTKSMTASKATPKVLRATKTTRSKDALRSKSKDANVGGPVAFKSNSKKSSKKEPSTDYGPNFDDGAKPGPPELPYPEVTCRRVEALCDHAAKAVSAFIARLRAMAKDNQTEVLAGEVILEQVLVLIEQRPVDGWLPDLWPAFVAAEVLRAGDILGKRPKSEPKLSGAARSDRRRRASEILDANIGGQTTESWYWENIETGWTGKRFIARLRNDDALSDDPVDCETLFDSLAEQTVRYMEGEKIMDVVLSVAEMLSLVGFDYSKNDDTLERAVRRFRERQKFEPQKT